MNYKKTIWKSIFFTILALLIATGILFCVMFWGFTATFGNLMYDIGCDNFASQLYIRAYDKNNEIIYCYKALNIKIKLGHSSDTIRLYEDFVADDEYAEFISDYKSNVEKMNVRVLEKSTILNEENFLTNAYIRALIKNHRKENAFEKALEEFAGYNSCTLVEQGVYALGNFVEDSSLFEKKYSGFEDNLIDEMQKYFHKSVSIFNENKYLDDNLSKSYLIALGNRIINLGQDINSLYSKIDGENVLIESNLQNMIDVNEIIKGLI